MLRKMRFEGLSRLDELVEAARGAGLELDDYAIDTTGAYGWPMCGNGLRGRLYLENNAELVVDAVNLVRDRRYAVLAEQHGSSDLRVTRLGSLDLEPERLKTGCQRGKNLVAGCPGPWLSFGDRRLGDDVDERSNPGGRSRVPGGSASTTATGSARAELRSCEAGKLAPAGRRPGARNGAKASRQPYTVDACALRRRSRHWRS